MPIPTVADSMGHAQSCAEKTLLVTALESVITALQTANDHGRMHNHCAAKHRDAVCALASDIASDIKRV